MKYSEDGLVCFNPKNHTYHKGDKKLKSVTSFISDYKNKFDSDYHSQRIAKREGKTQNEVLSEWKQKADNSTKMGTYLHLIFENYINGLPYFDSGIYSKEKVAVKFINDYFITERLTPISCETIVYNDFLAGQIDCLAKNSNEDIFILDWKSNSDISKNNYGKYMLNEFWAVPDSSYYHYCLQLCIYKKLSCNVKDCFIVHLKEDDYEIIRIEDVIKNIDLSFVGII